VLKRREEWNWWRRVTNTSLDHLLSLLDEKRMEGTVNFILYGRPQKKLAV